MLPDTCCDGTIRFQEFERYRLPDERNIAEETPKFFIVSRQQLLNRRIEDDEPPAAHLFDENGIPTDFTLPVKQDALRFYLRPRHFHDATFRLRHPVVMPICNQIGIIAFRSPTL